MEYSAFCFFLAESYAYDRASERDLGLFNNQLENKVAAETAAYLEGKRERQAKARSLRDRHGMATGVDAELEGIIARRRWPVLYENSMAERGGFEPPVEL